MAYLLLELLATVIVVAALCLAARYPRVFGFFAWEFGVSWTPGESASAHYLRAFKYWMSVCTFGVLVIGFAYLSIDREAFEYADGFFHVLAPMVLACGYVRSLGYYALHVYYKWRDAKPNKPLQAMPETPAPERRR